MICLARSINAKEALEIGMVSKVVDDIPELIKAAVDEVKNAAGQGQENSGRQSGNSRISRFPILPVAGKQPLSREVIAITVKTIQAGASAEHFRRGA